MWISVFVLIICYLIFYFYIDQPSTTLHNQQWIMHPLLLLVLRCRQSTMPPHRLIPPLCPDSNIRRIIHCKLHNTVLVLPEQCWCMALSLKFSAVRKSKTIIILLLLFHVESPDFDYKKYGGRKYNTCNIVRYVMNGNKATEWRRRVLIDGSRWCNEWGRTQN